MRKALILLIALGLFGASAVQGQFDPPTLENRNASTFEYYMLEVPNPGSMVADAQDGDWAWFDPDYVVTTDEWRDEGDRPLPSRSDFDVSLKMGWKGAPENRWYSFLAIHDDTLDHRGTDVFRWGGDMLGFGLDPQDHGRDRGDGGFGHEWVAAVGDLSPPVNHRYRYETSEAWLEYGVEPWCYFAVRVEPPELWGDGVWAPDTGGDTFYEFNVVVIEFIEDGGPSVSPIRDLDAQAGEGGFGLPFQFWIEDVEGPSTSVDDEGNTIGAFNSGSANDMTLRGAEASSRQYFSHAVLLRIGEYAAQATAVEETTWGRIKDSF